MTKKSHCMRTPPQQLFFMISFHFFFQALYLFLYLHFYNNTSPTANQSNSYVLALFVAAAAHWPALNLLDCVVLVVAAPANILKVENNIAPRQTPSLKVKRQSSSCVVGDGGGGGSRAALARQKNTKRYVNYVIWTTNMKGSSSVI